MASSRKKSTLKAAQKVAKKKTSAKKKSANKSAPKNAARKKSAAKKSASKSPAKVAAPARRPAAKKSSAKVTLPAVDEASAWVPLAAPPPVRRSTVRMPSTGRPILIIAGEHSGDLLGGDVVQELARLGYSRFFGTGGPHMQENGVEILEHIESLAIMGFVEALKAYRRLKGLADQILAAAVERDTALAILIDYPGFNLRFAKMLKAAGIPVVFLVSPQIWAWKYGRIRSIRENVDLMLPLFQFEKDMYDRENVPAHWIGHPLVNRVPKRLRKEEPIPPHSKLSAKKDLITVGILPGSRRSEITRLLPAMLGAAKQLHERYQRRGIRFLLAGIEERLSPEIQAELDKHPELPVELYYQRSLRIMEASDFLIIASGTATLEGAYFQKPMILLYKISLLNYMIIPLLIRTRFIGIVNLLAQRQAMIELIQSEVTPENIVREAVRIIEEPQYRDSLKAVLEEVRKNQLGRGNPAVRAAEYIVNFLRNRARSQVQV